MFVKTIKYKNFSGEDKSGTFMFNISKPELIDKELSEDSYMGRLQKIIETTDMKGIIEHIKWVVLGSYGVRSDDGERFIKTEEMTRNFEQSAAYEALYMELLMNAEAAAEFVTNAMPGDLQDLANQMAAKRAEWDETNGLVKKTAEETLRDLGLPPDTLPSSPSFAPPPPPQGPDVGLLHPDTLR